MEKELHLGPDVHKEVIVTALAEAGRQGQVRAGGTLSNDLQAVENKMSCCERERVQQQVETLK